MHGVREAKRLHYLKELFISAIQTQTFCPVVSILGPGYQYHSAIYVYVSIEYKINKLKI